jgi:tetratricopeptide (TPR) repeat protein
MRVYFGPKRVVVAGLFFGVALIGASFYWTNWRLNQARQARRDDAYGLAESLLAACWHFPSLSTAIALEEELLAVQQGDLRNELALQSRALVREADRNLILEALAKGNLASFQWNEAQLRADAILKRQPGDARALWLRARARIEMQQEDLARLDLEQAVKAEPTANVIRRSWADLLHKLGYVGEALVQYASFGFKSSPGWSLSQSN